MEVISSAHNNTIKRLAKLVNDRRVRQATGLTALDGQSLVFDYVQAGGVVETILFSRDELSSPAIKELIKMTQSTRQIVLPSNLFRKISAVENSQGVVAIVPVRAKEHDSFQPRNSRSVVVLERIQDPGNLGAILRSGLAFGVTDIFISLESVEAFSPKVVRASMGACFCLNIYPDAPLQAMLKKLKTSHQLIATSPHAVKTLSDIDLSTAPVIWMFGNEGSGLSTDLLDLANEVLRIPQSDQVESLNLASAVTVCLYEQLRQRQSFS